MTPLARLNAAADAVQAAADRINLIGDSDVPAELARSLHNATETVTSSASAVRGTAWEWERTASTVRTAAAFVAVAAYLGALTLAVKLVRDYRAGR
jgi:hypothetical protein